MIMFVFTAITRVTNQPDGLTTIITCEGRQAEYTCVLNSNIRSDDVQWYRFIKDTSATVMVNQHGTNISFANANGNTILTITNAQKSYNGYFWVEADSQIFCNASFTATTSTYVNKVLSYNYVCICIYVYTCIAYKLMFYHLKTRHYV